MCLGEACMLIPRFRCLSWRLPQKAAIESMHLGAVVERASTVFRLRKTGLYSLYIFSASAFCCAAPIAVRSLLPPMLFSYISLYIYRNAAPFCVSLPSFSALCNSCSTDSYTSLRLKLRAPWRV